MEGADCALAIRYQGSLYVAWGVEVAPREGTVLGTGVLPGCDDGTGASPDEALQVAELRGASPEVAVVWQGRTDVVFVRDGADPPPEVEKLVHGPTCEHRDERIAMTADWLGVLGPDGHTEVDLEPPYDLELFVQQASSPRYERTYLTVRVPASAGRPLTSDDVKASLWEGGTLTMQARCGPDGRYLADGVVAHPPD